MKSLGINGWIRNHALYAACMVAILLAALPAWPQDGGEEPRILFEEDFEAAAAQDNWDLTGDWRFKANSACLPNDDGYFSPIVALAFDYGTECLYRNNRSGLATLQFDVAIPITAPSARLEWWDFLAAEEGSDFAFVEVSTDGGLTWPHEVYRDSKDEAFWDQETADLSAFIGQSVRVRFGFTTDSTIRNLGWYVDDVRIVGDQLADGVSAIALGDAQITEGDSGTQVLSFPVQVSPANAEPIVLEHQTVGGTATSGLDFIASSGPITIPANTTTTTIGVFVVGDVFFEDSETFSLTVSNATDNAFVTIGSGTGTILDNEVLVTLYEEDFTPRVGTFQWDTTGLWHRQNESQCIPDTDGFNSPTHAMSYNREDTSDCGYDTVSGTSGALTMTRVVEIPNTAPDVSIRAELHFWSYLEIAYSSFQQERTEARVEISNDLGFTWTSLKTFRPEEPSEEPYTIPWSQTVINLDEYIGERIQVRFVFDQPAELNRNTAVGWYVDDVNILYAPLPEGVSKVTVGDATQNEGSQGVTRYAFPVTVVPPNPAPINLSFETVADSGPNAATEDEDFIVTQSQLSIPANTANANIEVLVIGDDVPESDETFLLDVNAVSTNLFLATEQALGTIANDDVPSTVSLSRGLDFDNPDLSVNEAAGTVTFNVELDPIRSTPVTLSYQSADGTAFGGPGLDYLPISGEISFPPNTSLATFTVTILNDTQFEDAVPPLPKDPETFSIEISSDTELALSNTFTVEIIDDDSTVPPGVSALTVDDIQVSEGSSPNLSAPDAQVVLRQAVFTVELDPAQNLPTGTPPGSEISLEYTTRDGTAKAGEDYQAISGTLNIPTQTAQVVLKVPVYADRFIEGPETFDVVLSMPMPADKIVVRKNVGVCTINDDDYEAMTFSADGAEVSRKPLADGDVETAQTLASSVTLNALEAQSYVFQEMYFWDGANQLGRIDLATGAVVRGAAAATSGGGDWTGLAWDHTNGEMLAVNTDGDFATVDLSALDVTNVYESGMGFVAMAVHPTTGRIYAVDGAATPALYEIDLGDLGDTTSGSATKLADLDFTNSVADPVQWDMDFDNRNGALFLSAQTAGGGDWELRELNVADGTSTFRIVMPAPGMLLATRPAPQSVAWTSDYAYASTDPSGLLIEGASELSMSDLGLDLGGVGDVNRDSYTDFAVTAPAADGGRGKVFVFFGGPGDNSVSRIMDRVFEAVEISDAYLTGENGFVLSGGTANEHVGGSLAGVGDMNADGIDDFAVGYNDAGGSGGVLLVYGDEIWPASVSSLDVGGAVQGVHIVGETPGGNAGSQLGGAGDFNGDGLPDLIIGANDGEAAYVVFGSNSGIGSGGGLNLQSMQPGSGVRIYGEVAGDAFGRTVSGLGDVNGDGVDDIAIGAPLHDGENGAVYVIYGHPDYAEGDAPSPLELVRLTDGDVQAPPVANSLAFTNVIPAVGDLSSTVNPPVDYPEDFGTLTGELPGFKLSGVADEQGNPARLGAAVTGVGDMNGDAIAELAAAAPLFDLASGAPDAGRVYLLMGTDTLPAAVAASDIGGAVEGLRISGVDWNDQAGAVLTAAGDTNGDGLLDLAIGMPDGTPEGFSGEIYLLYGGDGMDGDLSLRDLAGGWGSYVYNTLCDESDPFEFSMDYVYNPANGSVYRLTPNVETWINAQTYALDHRIGTAAVPGNLATVRSAEENAFLLAAFGGGRWIGFTDSDPPGVDSLAQEGTFYWVSGETPGYTNWNAGEPNNVGNEDYTAMYGTGTWNDLPGWVTRRGIVEFTPSTPNEFGDFDGNGIPDVWEDTDGDGLPDGFPASGPPQGCAGVKFGLSLGIAGDMDADGITDLLVGRNNGAFLVFGEGGPVASTYTNRMRSGKSPLSDIDTGGQNAGVDLGSEVSGHVGGTGTGAEGRPESRVTIRFTGGGTGPQLTQPSTQTVTLYREAAPDLAVVGDGGQEDDDRWTPSGVHWRVQTDRKGFERSEIDFYYLPGEVAGLDLQDVAVFYAKDDEPLSDTTVWSWLPFEHDPDRNVFTVSREHKEADPSESFNGYYALIQADLLTLLGGVIPAVGVLNQDVYSEGPEVEPEGRAFWSKQNRRLYAVCAGELTITWKNTNNEKVSTVKALNQWPAEAAPGEPEENYQFYVANSPAVDMTGADVEPGQLPQPDQLVFQYSELTCVDETLIVNEELISNDRMFAADLQLPPNPSQALQDDPSQISGRAFVMLATGPDPTDADLYFQLIKTIRVDNPQYSLGGASGAAWDIGKQIDAVTDPDYASFHDDLSGAPFVYYPLTPYAAVEKDNQGDVIRYDQFHDRDARTGAIVPVNTVETQAGGWPLTLVFYERGVKLIDALTGNPVLSEADNEPLPLFDWPHQVKAYDPEWPASASQIIIARQDGSGELGQGTFGTDLDVYYQNDSLAPGYNPNEEHALLRPYAAGTALFALRDDLNEADTSEAYALLAYRDPDTGAGRIKPYQVIDQTAEYPFAQWPGVEGDEDPYEGGAGALILPPYPLSTFAYADESEAISGPWFEDRNGSHWAAGAGSNVVGVDANGRNIYDDADIEMQYYYPVREGFFFPDGDYAVGENAPWLDNGSGTPVTVTYTVGWPEDVPTMKVGELLIEAKFGLPQINGQCSVDSVYQTVQAQAGIQGGNIGLNPRFTSVLLIDPVQTRSVDLDALPSGIKTTFAGSEKVFPDLPPELFYRMSYDENNRKLKFKGVLVDPVLGFDYVLINILSESDREALLSIDPDSSTEWINAVEDLYDLASNPILIEDSSTDPYDVLALTSGYAQGVGYVTLAMQNSTNCGSLPVSLEVIRVVDDLEPGGIAVVKPGCVFEEKLTLLHKNDFGGKPEAFEFEWLYLPDENGTIPDAPDVDDPADPWEAPPISTPTSGMGVNTITIEGPGLLTLTDNWFAVRYRTPGAGLPWSGRWSDWTPVQFAEGWIKRVVGEINPFTQRAGGGGIEGAEESFATFSDGQPNTLVSMISQAGPRFTGSVPLNCDNLDAFGLIPIYETVLNRGASLSIDALSPINNPGVNTALLLVASRINDLYMLLGNEAYADAADPTIAFGTDDGIYGAEATRIHAFMNQTSSLLEEELSLLRGRDDTYAPGVQQFPVYNRLVWNFTRDITGGEVAYALNYNIKDDVFEGNGEISEADAKELYPQGHGDAWGHYLTAMKRYYRLLNHPFYTWVVRSEAVLVGGQALTVDYIDEQRFAAAAAAKARAGAEVVNLTYRDAYVEDPDELWQGYRDSDEDRAWGMSEWASRAAQGAYIDWVVGNALLPSEDPNADDTGILRIDRRTVPELREVASSFADVLAKADMADAGMNPLGLGANVIPFDISPSLIDSGFTHFEQIYERAVSSLANAATVFNYANNSTQLLRRQADTLENFQKAVQQQELDFKSSLIEIFGYPYSDDIGPGGTYATGYDGPDLYHYMYVDASQLMGEDVDSELSYGVTLRDGLAVNGDGTLNYTTAPISFTMSTRGNVFGIIKPKGWTGSRRAVGELQRARSALIRAQAEFLTELDNYGGLVTEIDNQEDILLARYGLSTDRLSIQNDALNQLKTYNDLKIAMKAAETGLRRAAHLSEKIGAALGKSIPTVTGVIVGFSNGVIIDGLSPVRSGIETAGIVVSEVLQVLADVADVAEYTIGTLNDEYQAQASIDLDVKDAEFAELGELKALENLFLDELPQRLLVFSKFEAMQAAANRFYTALAEGQRIMERREIFRRQTSAETQARRYKDMAFRLFRNEALLKYRAQFDLAARYVYMAAKAYDYETTMLGTDTMSGQRFLTDIVKARQIGIIQGGLPQTGVGLADSMARMSRNFEVLSGQLGFVNPQAETNRFSLRRELFRAAPGPDGDDFWRDKLSAARVDDIWSLPEVRRLCVPPEGDLSSEPGLVIDFGTTITEGLNFFGKPIGGRDSSYDSTQFATKIRSVGVWFSNYDNLNLTNTPRVYLVPVGADLLRSPTGYAGTPREFNVLDQLLPTPYSLGQEELEEPEWIPSVDSLGGQFEALRRHGRFRAYHDSGSFNASEVHRDSRLVGRSVWNTRWLLVVPGTTLHNDPEEGLDRFIDGAPLDGQEGRDGNGVSDILLFFETYAYPRAKSQAKASGGDSALNADDVAEVTVLGAGVLEAGLEDDTDAGE